MPTMIKEVNGKKYVYFYYYSKKDGHKKEVYCGRFCPESINKAKQMEIDRLRKIIQKNTALIDRYTKTIH